MKRVAALVGFAGLALAGGLEGLAVGQPSNLLTLADQILAEISHIRRLSVEAPVQRGVMSREEIRNALQAKIQQEFEAEELAIERKTLVKLGLLPAGYDYVNGVLNLLQDQLAGYYDPDTKTFYIADWLGQEEQKATMAHELMHALQDQHFGLMGIIGEPKGNDDRLQARRAIVEGEALAVMFDYLLRPLRRDFLNLPDLRQVYTASLQQDDERLKQLQAAPEFLRETLLFPYVHGARFLQVYRRWHSWEDVAKLYSQPPNSTEQILHPSKYAGMRDEPTEVAAVKPEEFPEEWKAQYRNVLGEFGWYLLLKQFLPEQDAARASRGWDGDSVQLFEHQDGRRGLFLKTVWDSAADAEQFFEAYAGLVAEKYPSAKETPASEGGDRREWSSQTDRIIVKREGDWVSVWEIETAPPAK